MRKFYNSLAVLKCVKIREFCDFFKIRKIRKLRILELCFQNYLSGRPKNVDGRLKRSPDRQQFYYRAMHFSAKRGIAIACRLSVCLSVCDVGEL